MVSAEHIVEQQDRETRTWHRSAATPQSEAETDWLRLVSGQHRANFELWHIEDEARVPGASDKEIASVKRRIDPVNQRRNDLAEGLDRALLAWLEPRGSAQPGGGAALRVAGADDRPALDSGAEDLSHPRRGRARRRSCRARRAQPGRGWPFCEEQRGDLAACLDALWSETLGGTRRFKLYRQLKMYNDPSLNPAVYGHSGGAKNLESAGKTDSRAGQP